MFDPYDPRPESTKRDDLWSDFYAAERQRLNGLTPVNGPMNGLTLEEKSYIEWCILKAHMQEDDDPDQDFYWSEVCDGAHRYQIQRSITKKLDL